MKTDKYQRRFYRDWSRSKDLHFTHIIAKETDLQILTNKPLDKKFVEERVRSLRWDIEHYISKDHRFLTSLKPIVVELGAPQIVRDMNEAARLANVGPMASVAGAVAEYLGKDLLKAGYRDVIVENGGDIFLKTSRVRAVGIYAGKSKILNKLKLRVRPKDTPLGICASSGTVGHSLSFGCADSVVIFSKSALLADAVATAACNRINSKEDMQKALEFARGVKGVTGAVVILKNSLVTWGDIEFVDKI